MMSRKVKLVSIQIVTLNRLENLVRCIESAMAQTWPLTEIVVIDNASTDGTAQKVSERFCDVRLIRSHYNSGCPTARNLGYANCRGEYIYTLDDDGWLKEDAVETAVKQIEKDPKLAVVMSQIKIVQNGRFVRNEPSGWNGPLFTASFAGGCSLIRRKALQQAGYFPDDFFRQAEEDDLALRLIDKGWLMAFEPTSIMYHAPHSVGRDLQQFRFYALRNSSKTALRLYPVPFNIVRVMANLIRSVRDVFLRGYFTMPLRLIVAVLIDVVVIREKRRPVSREAYWLYWRLKRRPSTQRPNPCGGGPRL